AFLVALTATLGSLYFSEIANFVPCVLCWYQRILMYPLVIIILVGWIEQDEFLPKYVLPLSIGGILLSSYHYTVQLGLFGSDAVCAVGVPCFIRYINWAGFITIPFLALVAFTMITILMLVIRFSQSKE
ncbi:MAG: disulfide oxidoreductase, partial [Anaerolineales bacterium]